MKTEIKMVRAGFRALFESDNNIDEEVEVCIRCGGTPCYWLQNGDEAISAVVQKFGSA